MGILGTLCFLLATVPIITEAQTECYVPGEVIGGTLITYSIVGSYNECRAFCRTNQKCKFFTFMGGQPQAACLLYTDCGTIEQNCPNCFSGEKSCPSAEPVCGASGFCEGTSLNVPPADSASACQKACHGNQDCQWYSFLPSLGRCFLSSQCSKVGTCSDGCTHGERSCFPVQEKYFQTMVIVGGYDASRNSYLDTVQMLDLSGRKGGCTLLPYPQKLSGAFGTFLDGKIVVCGGKDGDNYEDECYYLERGRCEWMKDNNSLSKSRHRAASVKLSPSEWWIAGGAASGGCLNASEIKTFGSPPISYTALPVDAINNNLFQINDTHYVLVTTAFYSFPEHVWIFDKEKVEWSHLTNVPDTLDISSTGNIGFVKYKNGTRQLLFFQTAYPTDYCYGLDLDTLEWTVLEPSPHSTFLTNVLPYGDTFVYAGFPKVVMFDPDLEDWIELVHLPWSSPDPRPNGIPFLVPDDFWECCTRVCLS